MKTVTHLGIDLAKNTFQLHGVNDKGQCVLKKQLSRTKLITFIAKLPVCQIAMESCAGSHFWSRKFQSFGHEVKLISPQFVKPFVRGNKDDAADAEAIVEASLRPHMNFVTPKEIWQQDLQSVHRIRQRLVRNRTALMNEIRGILFEYGIVIPQGRSALKEAIISLLNDGMSSWDLTRNGKEFLQELYSELLEIEQRIDDYESQLKQCSQNTDICQKLLKVPGFGFLSVTALLSSVGNPNQFQNGRQFAAWVGLVPRHTGTGGKNRLLGISKRGDRYLRALLVHGARAKLRAIIRKTTQGQDLDALSQWSFQLYSKKGFNKACVALANKNARIAWAMMSSKSEFSINKTTGIQQEAA